MSNQVQSYVSTVMHGKLSVNEVRVFMGIVKQCQELIYKEAEKGPLVGRRLDAGDLDFRFTLSVADLLPENSHHYAELKEACKRLMKRVVESYDTDARRWSAGHLIDKAVIDAGKGTVFLQVSEWVFANILDFSIGGPKKYSLENALRISKGSTLRLYMLLWNQKQDITYSIKGLKEMLGVKDNYRQTNDFLKRCIDPAQEELAKLGINGFTYEKIKDGDKQTSKLKALRFHPLKREAESLQSVAMSLPQSSVISRETSDYFEQSLGFTANDMIKFRGLLLQFCNLPGWQGRLDRIVERARQKRKNRYYIVAAMKGEVKGV